MKCFLLTIFLFSSVCCVLGDQLIYGKCEPRGSTRVSLMKVIIDPESCLNERISVFGHLVLFEGSESMLYFSEEAMDSIDVGNAVPIRAEDLSSFLVESKREPYSNRVYIQGFVKYNPKIKNKERRVWIEADCIVFGVKKITNENEG